MKSDTFVIATILHFQNYVMRLELYFHEILFSTTNSAFNIYQRDKEIIFEICHIFRFRIENVKL